MTTQDLGPRTQLGVSDASLQINPYLRGTGWDVVFDPTVWATNLTGLEVYHISLDGPVGSSVKVTRNNQPWDFVLQGWANGWDPSEPMPFGQTDTVAFLWNTAFAAAPYSYPANVQPTVTCWIRTNSNYIGGS